MGYVIVDHRSSPPSVQSEFGRLIEYDTVSCKHCQAVIKVYRRQPQGAYCARCAGPVCDRPPCNVRCEPFFAQLEKAIAKMEFHNRLEKLGFFQEQAAKERREKEKEFWERLKVNS